MIVNMGAFRAFGGEWEDYCGREYANQPDLRAKCMESKGGGPFPCPPWAVAPWTECGKKARGLPINNPGAISLIGSITGGASTEQVAGQAASTVASATSQSTPRAVPGAGPTPYAPPATQHSFVAPFLPSGKMGPVVIVGGIAVAGVAVALLLGRSKKPASAPALSGYSRSRRRRSRR